MSPTQKNQVPSHVFCPKCKAVVDWHKNSQRPFCSQRCRILDLGSWAAEEYRIDEDTSHLPLGYEPEE